MSDAGMFDRSIKIVPSCVAVTLFTFEKEAPFTMLDKEVYIHDLPTSNKNGYATWIKEYSAQELYGVKDLSVESLNDLIVRLGENRTLFDQYYMNMHASSVEQTYYRDCKDDQCRKEVLCCMTNMIHSEIQSCMSS